MSSAFSYRMSLVISVKTISETQRGGNQIIMKHKKAKEQMWTSELRNLAVNRKKEIR